MKINDLVKNLNEKVLPNDVQIHMLYSLKEEPNGDTEIDIGNFSDGKNTFGELYNQLYMAYVMFIQTKLPFIWKTKILSDGTEIKDYFVVWFFNIAEDPVWFVFPDKFLEGIEWMGIRDIDDIRMIPDCIECSEEEIKGIMNYYDSNLEGDENEI